MGELMQQYIDEAEQDLLHTYNRYQVVLDRGDGVSLYDIEGKRYLDFVAGIAVFALGYHNAEYNDALKAQIDKVIHTSNYYYNVPAVEAARHLKKVSRMDRVFFTNSGAEAIEGAIKAARKYAYLKDGTTDHEIIAMNHSFHGRTMGALSVTGNPHYREAFEPGIGNIRFADLNDFDSVLACVNDKTCAILLETVQGEGGIYPVQEDFLKKVRALCDEKDILLILDEIGRGTSTFDGLPIAWAVLEYIADTKQIGAKTLFATHYHELSELEGKLSGVKNYCIAVQEQGEDIIFLRKIQRGGADHSYGVQVARLAGLPNKVIRRSGQILKQLNAADITKKAKQIAVESKEQQEETAQQMDMFHIAETQLADEISKLDVMAMTPIEALQTLFELQKKAKGL